MIYAILAQLRSSIKKPKRIVQNIYKVKPQTVKQYHLVTVCRPSRTESKVQTLIENSKAPRGSFHFIQSKIRKEAEKPRARAHSKAPRGSFHFVPSKIRKEAEKPRARARGVDFSHLIVPDWILYFQINCITRIRNQEARTPQNRQRIVVGHVFNMEFSSTWTQTCQVHILEEKKSFFNSILF